jgi:WS/DGAT/MGAT family acyltransferase
MRQLGGIDTMFVRGETPTMHLHVCGVLVLDTGGMRGDDARQRARALVAERLPLLAPFRWRLIETPGGIGAPRWIEDPDFDLDRHLHLSTLPAPGSRRELERFVANVAGTPLDRDRPLWEMYVVDGITDDAIGGSVAVVTKLHHAFMDGGAGAEIMASLFDLEPDADTPAPVDDWVPEPVPSTTELLVDAAATGLSRAGRIPATLARTAAGMTGLIGAMFPSVDGARQGTTAPRTPFNGALTPDRSVVLGGCSLADVKRVKTAFGVTVNDVVLAAVTTSLRRELGALGALDALGNRPLVAAVPVSVRPADLERGFGNHTSAMMVPLPAHLADPVERLHAIHAVADHTKQQHQAMGSDLLESWAGLVPPWAISAGSRTASTLGLSRFAPPLFNLIVSNVQGPPIDLYLAGAKVTAIYPLGPLMDGCGLNVTVISQGDTLHIGLVADPSLVAHPHALTEGLGAGVDELLDRIPRPERSNATAPTRRSRARTAPPA